MIIKIEDLKKGELPVNKIIQRKLVGGGSYEV